MVELVTKMQEMTMDKTELGCLRAIVLFNPDVKGLKEISRYILTFNTLSIFISFHLNPLPCRVEQLRERVYASLEEYTRTTNENEMGRFAKLLLRLPGAVLETRPKQRVSKGTVCYGASDEISEFLSV